MCAIKLWFNVCVVWDSSSHFQLYYCFIKIYFYNVFSPWSDSQPLIVPFPFICFVLFIFPVSGLITIQGFKKCSANSNIFFLLSSLVPINKCLSSLRIKTFLLWVGGWAQFAKDKWNLKMSNGSIQNNQGQETRKLLRDEGCFLSHLWVTGGGAGSQQGLLKSLLVGWIDELIS